MNNVARITQEELIQLIAEKITADGFKVIPADYEIEFVTSASGKTSALVTGVVKDPDLDEEGQVVPRQSMLAPYPVTSVITPAKPVAHEDLPLELERSTRVALQVALTFKPQTQEKLVKKVLETLMREVPAEDAVPSSQMKRQVNAIVITALQAGAQLTYVEDIDSWHKKRRTKTTEAQAASDILGGSGGAMGRGDALGAGVGSD